MTGSDPTTMSPPGYVGAGPPGYEQLANILVQPNDQLRASPDSTLTRHLAQVPSSFTLQSGINIQWSQQAQPLHPRQECSVPALQRLQRTTAGLLKRSAESDDAATSLLSGLWGTSRTVQVSLFPKAHSSSQNTRQMHAALRIQK